MITIVVSVYDVSAKAFGRPVFAPAIGAALRSFSDEVNRNAPDNVMFHHPEDFILFELGEFDDLTGRFVLLDTPKNVASGKTVKVVLK